MSRRSRSSFRDLSVPSLLVIGALFAFRYWQESKQAPQKPTHHTSRSQSNAQSKSRQSTTPSGASSNEGHLLLGAPTVAGKSPDNFLLERSEYAMSYNSSKGGPNWVSWHTDASDLGDIERGRFAPDPELPTSWQIRPNDYKGSGYDRGHLCPSGDRTTSRSANNATFYMSNMLPQTADLNQHPWADLENYLRDQIRAGNEIYQVAGGAGVAKTIAGGKITVPQVCWKVAVILSEGRGDLKRINSKTRVLAVVMPNAEDERLANGDWRAYLTTPSKIQSTIKVDLFSALPANIQKALEAKTDTGA
jgi:endonuclease G